MSQKNLLPTRKGKAKKPSDASMLLHAIVIAIRDGRPRSDLVKLIQTYPRVMNRDNPFLPLIDEIGTLRQQTGQLFEQEELLKLVDGRLEAWTNHQSRFGGKYFKAALYKTAGEMWEKLRAPFGAQGEKND